MIEVADITQSVVNWTIGVVGSVSGVLAKVLWGNIEALQKRDDELSYQIAKVELLVAGNYVNKDDFEKAMDKVIMKLDKIDDKIDRKADK
jgi:hypothetical protein